MTHIHDILRARLLRRVEAINNPPPLKDYHSLVKSEWSPAFERLMRNRLIMGALRYGLLHAPGKPKYDRIRSMKERLDLYSATGNKELLVDVANLCLLEFEECYHPKAHFAASDDGEHVKPL